MDVALSLPTDAAEQLASTARRHGHRVAARAHTADQLVEAIADAGAALVVALASPHHLTARLIERCDALGIPISVVAGSAVERRHASALGIIDTVEGPPSWDRITPLLTLGSSPDAAPPGGGMPGGGMPGGGMPDGTLPAVPTRLAPAPIPPSRSGPKLGMPDPWSTQPESAGSSRWEPGDASVRSGSVVVVWGPAGAPGRTSIAIAIAAELAAAGVYTALADADTHGASVAPALGLLDEAPGFAAACRLAGADALTRDEFERIGEFRRAPRGGFWVLTGLGRPSRWPELSAQRVSGAIAAARGWVDVLVLDVAASLEHDEELSSDVAAPRRNAATLEALRAADHVVAVAAADPIGLARFLRLHEELREATDSSRLTVVANKVRASAIGSGAASQVRQTLARFGNIDDPVLVPWDPAGFDAALLSGRPITDAAPRSAARAAIRQLVADRILPARVAAERAG
jgi:MinD-like ATPase involved in chromosome partitioning or flagellar assembly